MSANLTLEITSVTYSARYQLLHKVLIAMFTLLSYFFSILDRSNWDFARARSTYVFVRNIWQMKIDLLITSKR